MSATPHAAHRPTSFARRSDVDSNLVLKSLEANELVFAVVGPAGSGTSKIAEVLRQRATDLTPNTEVEIIKGSAVIQEWAEENFFPISDKNSLLRAQSLQDAGDKIRETNSAGVAVRLIAAIRAHRDALDTKRVRNNQTASEAPFRVYILDSLKHPAEVELLRRVYREAFCVIGVVCETNQRLKRLQDAKCTDSSPKDVKRFIARDEDAGFAHGQKVADTFHLADFFVDNTPERILDHKENPLWDVNDQLGRLFDILIHKKLCRPTPSETGMFHAYGAQLRSACLSRQVGAALMDRQGNLLSTGTNEVPRAGGGVYGGVFFDSEHDPLTDNRCAHYGGYCRNTQVAINIVSELVEAIPELENAQHATLRQRLKKTSLGRLLEFSRAVHAEMDALLSAARQGASPVGGRLFTTTFPCHYCARHIVSAGIDEVQYIEPYPKSRALELHGDAIVQSRDGWIAPSSAVSNGQNRSAVLFRPFTGVAPRMYRRAFFKDRKLKDDTGHMSFGEPEWASGLLRKSYKDIEKALLDHGANDEQAHGDRS